MFGASDVIYIFCVVVSRPFHFCNKEWIWEEISFFCYTLFNLCQCLTKAFLLQKNIFLIWGFLIRSFHHCFLLHVYALYCLSILFCSGKSELKILSIICNSRNWKVIKILIFIHCFVKSLLHPLIILFKHSLLMHMKQLL